MTKPIWQSKTFMLNLLSLIFMLLNQFGVIEVTESDQAAISIMVVNVVNMVLRMVTKSSVTLT